MLREMSAYVCHSTIVEFAYHLRGYRNNKSAIRIGSMTGFYIDMHMAKFYWQLKKSKRKAANQKLPSQPLEGYS